MTQEELADRCGVTKQAVSAWELGDSQPQGSARILLSAALLQPLDVINAWFERAEKTA